MKGNVIPVVLYILQLTLAPSTPQSTTGVAISYSLATHSLTLHEPVVLDFSAKNETDRAVTLDLGQDRKGGYEFWVTPPSGTRVKLPRYSRGGFTIGSKVSIEPGETFSQSLVLSEFYAFPLPGTYQLEGRLTQPIILNGGATQETDSGFHGVIEIGPRDDARLEAACNSLADRVDDSQTYEQAAQAALALSHVNDPVAVTSLRRALFARKLVEAIAIHGLEKIGDDAAIRVLGSAMEANLPGDTAVLARAALQRIQQETPDAARKKAIREILTANHNNQ